MLLGWFWFILLLGLWGRNSLLVSRGQGVLFSWPLEPKPDNTTDQSHCDPRALPHVGCVLFSAQPLLGTEGGVPRAPAEV